MTMLWARRDIDAPAGVLWTLLTEPEYWPVWGPTVNDAVLRGDKLELGATGTVSTILALRLDFEITAFEDGASWSWKVAGVAATDHTVESLGPDACRVGFGVPWPAAPYLAVCHVALQRLERLAHQQKVGS